MKLKQRNTGQGSSRTRGTAAMLILALGLAACSGETEAELSSTEATSPSAEATTTIPAEQASLDAAVVEVDADGTTTIDQSQLEAQLATMPTGTLTPEDEEGLLLMREEEKLAHDVYVALYDMWQVQIFSNISDAETTHTDAVLTLLDRYGLDDPVDDNPEGVFTNPELQELYNDLVAQGSESLVEALKVGALIEDLDIYDLRSLETQVADIAQVYDSLEKGSRNHMRSFIKNLEQQGETYTPMFLTPEEFEEIVSTPTERGNNG